MSTRVRSVLWLAASVVGICGASWTLPATSPAQGPVAVTYDKVIEYLQIGLPEERIVALVRQSPTSFVLGEEQLRQLRQAGAGEALLGELQKRKGEATVAAGDVTDVVLILDCSGSMNELIPGGGTKWNAAKKAATDLVQNLPAGRNLSFVIYGRDLERECGSIDVLRPLSPLADTDRHPLIQAIDALSPAGLTPIARSLKVAGAELARGRGLATMVLITDGMESCRGNPSAEAALLLQSNPRLKGGINVVGFCLRDAELAGVQQIARLGGGHFYDARTAGQMLESLRRVERTLVRAGLFPQMNLEGLSPLDRILIQQLADPAMSVREAAAKAIGERNVAAAVPALARLIIERDMGRGLNADYDRNEALHALLKLAPDKVAAVLGEALHSPNVFVRGWAVEAVTTHHVIGAVDCVEGRMLCLTDREVNPGLIDGYDEADRLFKCLKAFDVRRLEGVMARLLQCESRHVREWAAKRLPDLP